MTFHVRPGRATEYGPTSAVALYDLRRSWRGKTVKESVPVRLEEHLPDDHDYDLILLSVQHYRFDEAAAFLGPRVSGATVLVFNNLWAEPDAAAAALPAEHLVWGFPMAGGGFAPDGTLRGSLLPSIILGTFGTEPTDRYRAVEELFRTAGFGVQEQRDFRGWLLIHFALNCGMHGRVLQAGSFTQMLETTASQALLDLRELVPLLEARGVELASHRAEMVPFRMPAWLGGPALRLVMTAHPTLRAVTENHANLDELRHTCRDVLDDARRRGVPLPRLEALEAGFRPTSG